MQLHSTTRDGLKPGNRRVTGKEQYYTPQSVAAEIFERVLPRMSGNAVKRFSFLEPAGGTGAFVEIARSVGFGHIIALDIEPRHPDVVAGDFLKQSLELHSAVCVTNPPFGRNNSLSVPFFNQAAKYCDLIAFIVPRSWRKWSVLNRLDQRFRLVADWDLHIDYVDEFGEQSHGVGNLRTCVQVWRRERDWRRELVRIPDFGVVRRSTPEQADVSLTLFGYGCGTVKTDFPRTKNSTQTYLKLQHPQALEALQSVDFSLFFNHTSYTEALSQPEINFLLNNYLGLDSREYSVDPASSDYLGLRYQQV